MEGLPLRSIKVIDLTQNVAGPFCTQILGDLGADVIKVEPPGGDGTRSWGPPFWESESVMFLAFNRNKRSLCLDLKSKEGRGVLDRLLVSADVCVTAMTPSAAVQLGVDPATLQGVHKSLIVCDISAFGARGPMRDLPGFDPVVQAISGIMSVTGDENGNSIRVGTSIVDMGVGMWAAIGILAATTGRADDGKGASVATSLLETAIAWIPYQAMGFLATSQQPKKWGSELSMLVPYGAYRAADTDVVIAVGNEAIWRRFCVSIDRPDLSTAPGFCTNPERVANRSKVRLEVETELRRDIAAVWEERFRNAGVPASRVNTIPEAMELDQVAMMEMFQDTSHVAIEGLKTVRAPLSFDGRPGRPGPPPLAGQHSSEVLAEIGYDDAEIDRLREHGVVA